MKNGSKVMTEHGEGEIISKEMGVRSCVRLESCPDNLLYLQDRQGGLFYWDSEIDLIKDDRKRL